MSVTKRHPLRAFAAILLALAAGAPGKLRAQQPLTSAAEVRALPLEQAELEIPVRLEARVAHLSHPGTVFIQDDEAGTFFRTSEPVDGLRIGDRVRVRGVTFKGLYLTGIQAGEWERLAPGEPPPARDAVFEDLATGRFHYQRVRVRGVVRTAESLGENQTRLTLALGRQLLEVRLDAAPEPEHDWADTLVEVTGLAAGSINDRRQLVQPHLLVDSWRQVAVISPPLPLEDAPLVSAAGLLRFQSTADAPHLRRVRLRGQVLAALPDGRLFLRDAAADPPVAFSALTAQAAPALQPGDQVELAGFPEMSGFSARLAEARILKREEGTPPAPRVAALSELPSAESDSELVTVEGAVVSQSNSASGTEWQIQDGENTLLATLPGGYPGQLAPQTRVRVSGICEIFSSVERGFRAVPERARLLLRSDADLLVLQSPPWWTAGRLLGLVAVLGTAILAASVWITLLRRRVARQAESLRARIASAAALEERQRIAREFHDTLEQELAGLSIRLGALGALPQPPKAGELLADSQQLVSRVQTEARNLVADLRAAPQESPTGLAAALQDLAARQPQDGAPAMHWHLDPSLPPLPGPVVHQLRMITQESLTNALKHAQASRIDITTRMEAHQLTLSVRDDGRGIAEPASVGEPPAGHAGSHFGLIGIRERCRKIGANVEWLTAPGEGTEVKVTLPLPVSD